MNWKLWRKEGVLMQKRLDNPAICLIAFHDISTDEAETRLIGSRKTYEKALASAEAADAISRRSFGCQGGKVAKTNSLQDLISKIVRSKPQISERNLVKILREMANRESSVIDGVDCNADLLVGEHLKIHFTDRGVEKTALISGLKDRLYRAKKPFRAIPLARVPIA
jgi:hypothetical protein